MSTIQHTLEESFHILKQFLETRPASKQAAKSLKKGVEIGLVINNSFQMAFYQEGGAPVLSDREAINPDVIFYLTPEAIRNLTANNGDDMAELGIEVLREYLAENLSIHYQGSLLGFMRHGYLGIIKDAGLPFAKFLAAHGVENITKIPELINKLRKPKV